MATILPTEAEYIGNSSTNVLVAYNHIYGNGIYGEQQGAWDPGACGLDAHGVYGEASNITYLGNRFGGPKQGEGTDLLKDRSSGLVVAFNLFEPDGVLEAAFALSRPLPPEEEHRDLV